MKKYLLLFLIIFFLPFKVVWAADSNLAAYISNLQSEGLITATQLKWYQNGFVDVQLYDGYPRT